MVFSVMRAVSYGSAALTRDLLVLVVTPPGWRGAGVVSFGTGASEECDRRVSPGATRACPPRGRRLSGPWAPPHARPAARRGGDARRCQRRLLHPSRTGP